MKALKIFVWLMFATTFISVANAQNAGNNVKALIDAQNFVFVAQNVTPMSGRMRLLTTEYTLTVTRDSVIADLPYFGRAYSASINPEDAGIQFNTNNFQYTSTVTKKHWEVSIKPKNAGDTQQMFLNIFDNGSADLQVTSNNRQSISFSGYIKQR